MGNGNSAEYKVIQSFIGTIDPNLNASQNFENMLKTKTLIAWTSIYQRTSAKWICLKEMKVNTKKNTSIDNTSKNRNSKFLEFEHKEQSNHITLIKTVSTRDYAETLFEQYYAKCKPDPVVNPDQQVGDLFKCDVTPLKFADIFKYVQPDEVNRLEFDFKQLSDNSNGAFGAVGNVFVKAKLKFHLQGVAKDINLKPQDKTLDQELIRSEINMLNFIKTKQDDDEEGSEFCLDFLGWWDGNRQWCNKPNHIFILTEKYEMDLVKAITSRKSYNTIEVFIQICKGLKFLHSNNIAHLDLKLANIMFTDKTLKKIKIIDFGLAIEISKPLKIWRGTPGYISPEMNSGQRITTKADMFAAGAILYELVKKTSFGHAVGIVNRDTRKEAYANLSLKVSRITDNLPYNDIMRMCLQEDPDGRARAAVVINTAHAKYGSEVRLRF